MNPPDSAPARAPIWEVALISTLGLLAGLSLYRGLSTLYPGFVSIAHHYAGQFRSGNGLVFNPGEPVLLVATPLYLLLLGILPLALPFAVGLAIGVGSAYHLARQETDRLTALLLAGAYGCFLGFGAGTPYPLAAGLCLFGMMLVLHQRPWWGGVIFALACGTTPESLLPALIVLMVATQRKGADRFALGLLILLLGLIAGLIAYYGEGLRGVLTGPSYLMWQIGLIQVCIGLSTPLLARFLNRLPLIIQKGVPLLLMISAAVILVPISLSNPPEAIDSIRVPVERLGLGYARTFSDWDHPLDQTWIAFDGDYQPDIRAMAEVGDHRSMLVKYAPLVILVDRRVFDPQFFFGEETLNRLGYTLSEDGERWKIGREPGKTFSLTPFEFRFTPDLSLTAVALDAPPQGGVQRIGLYWRLERSAVRPITARFRLEREGKTVDNFSDEIAPTIMRVGSPITYHALPLPDHVPPAALRLYLRVIINDGSAGGEALIDGD